MTAPDRYTCEDAFRRISDYLDRELTAAEMRMVQAHLETCAMCASEFRFEASVLREIRRKLEHLDLPAEHAGRISTLLHAAAREEEPD